MEEILEEASTPGKSYAVQIRYNCVQNWFLKASSKSKLKLLIHMIENLRDQSYLRTFASCFNYKTDKMLMYSDCQPTTNYIYDLRLKDHNRGLDDEFLSETIKNDLDWFRELDLDDQITTITELLNISGGAILKQFYAILTENLIPNIDDKPKEIEAEERIDLNELFLPKEADAVVTSESEFEKSKSDKKGKKKEKKTKKAKKKTKDKKPKTPSEIEVEQKRKIWENEIRKYKISIFGKPEKDKKKKGKSSKSSTTAKKSKSSKLSKKSKSSMKSKSSKGSKKSKKKDKTKEFADRIQMLPVWIVKKIFGYLDAKTLKKISAVNRYWEYVVDDMAKTKKTMAAVHKMIKKLEENIKDNEIPDLKRHGLLMKPSHGDKKMLELAQRGAVIEQLRPVVEQPVEDKPILLKAITLYDSHSRHHSNVYESFPRETGDDKELLNRPNIGFVEAGVFGYRKERDTEGNWIKQESEGSSHVSHD